MTSDPELDAWRADWQSADQIPPELRRRVEQHIRAGRHTWWPPITVTVVIGGGTLAWAVTSGEHVAAQTAVATWLFIAVTWATTLVLLRRFGGRLRPDAATTASFLDFAIRVCRATRAGIVAGAVLYALFVSYMLFWRFQTGPFGTAGEYLFSGRVVAMVIVTVLLGLAGWRRYGRLGMELEGLLAMQRQIVDMPTVSDDRSRRANR
ncbi:MAG: hypothetical protein IT183_06085 [Acidobacteria bacterium]|nr:hypothetical protein [Acidobacteriota bacterium]